MLPDVMLLFLIIHVTSQNVSPCKEYANAALRGAGTHYKSCRITP